MDNTEHYRLWTETRRSVATLHRAVERGECVTQAIHFAKYLLWSGILRECKAHRGDEIPDGLRTDGGLLEWETSELLQLALSVPEVKRLGSFEEKVFKNLELIAGELQRLKAPPVSASPSTPGGAS